MALSEWKYPKYRPRRGSFAAYRRTHQRKMKEKARRAKRFHIKALDLSGDEEHFRYRMTDIPQVVFESVELQVLNLRRNLITSLPDDIGNLKDLISLNLGDNQLTNLPDSMENLKKLERLYLHSNQFYNLPPVIGKLENLKELYIYGNHLITIPDWISDLKNLVVLDLDDNKLNKLPESIAKLEELVSLNVGGNRLFNLPETMGEMRNLSFFYFHHNRFLTVPRQVYELDALKVLWLNENKIKDISVNIGKLKDLKIINLDNNPLRHQPPPDLIARGADAIREYYMKGGQVPAQRVFTLAVPGEETETSGNEIIGYKEIKKEINKKEGTKEGTKEGERRKHEIKEVKPVRRVSVVHTDEASDSPSPLSKQTSGKTFFITYAAGDESDTLVDRLEIELKKQGADVIRSGHNLMYPASLSTFLSEGPMKRGIIAVLSQGFLYSDICMLDLSTLVENVDFKKRFFPVVMSDVQLNDTFEFDHKLNFWNKKIIELYRAMKLVSSRERMVLQEEIKRYQSIRLKLSEVSETIKRLDVKNAGDLKTSQGMNQFVNAILRAL